MGRAFTCTRTHIHTPHTTLCRKCLDTCISALSIGHRLPTHRFVDLRNEAGLMPLHFAVWGAQPDCVRVLLSYRADITARSNLDYMAQVGLGSAFRIGRGL